MDDLRKLKKKLNSLGNKYENVNPRAVLKRSELQYRMVRLQQKIINIQRAHGGW